MQLAFFLLIGLIGLSPLFLLFDGLLIQGAITGYTAILIIITALSLRQGEGDHLFKVIRSIALLAMIIPIWMVIQILPIPIGQFAHPIWLSATSALEQPLFGSLSIDRGATLLALCRYCFAIGIVFVATAVTIDRLRAELMLICLTALTTLAAVLLLASGLAEIHLSTELISLQIRSAATALSALGVVVNLANIVRAFERHETRRATQDISRSAFMARMIAFVVALLVCLGAIAAFSTAQILFATASGFATFIIIVVIRRLGLRVWENAAIIALIATTLIIISVVNLGPGELSLQFAKVPVSQMSIAFNAMSNTPWAGNGAGTFGLMVPIYRDADSIFNGPYAPTTAATAIIELGRPAFWVALLCSLIFLGLLFSAALERGRDSFYATAGASCVVLLALEAFSDSSIFITPVLIFSAAILGLSIAQRASRVDQSRISVS